MINLKHHIETSLKPRGLFTTIENLYTNYKTIRLLEKKFEDFTEIQFPFQIGKIYNQITNALIKGETPLLMRSLYNIQFTEDNIFHQNKRMELFNHIKQRQTFYQTKGNWELNFIRLIERDTHAFAAFRFKEDPTNKMFNLFVIRSLNDTTSYYGWKIVLP